MNNYERANHGDHENQDKRIAHQVRQVNRREKRKELEAARLKKQ